MGRSTVAGRDRELEELGEAITATTGRVGRLVLISGEPGIGKTRLAAWAASTAAHAGHLVAWGHTWESGGAPPFWPWTQVLRSCERATDPGDPTGGRDQQAAGDLLSTPSQSVAAPEERFGLYDAATTQLLRACRSAPLTVVLEDLHAADEPSLQLLRFLAPQLRGSRLLVIGTFREAEASADPAVSTLLAETSRVGDHLRLRGLDVDGARELAAGDLDEQPDEAVAQLVDRTGGNPLFLQEILRLRAAGDTTTRVPATAADLIRRRIGRLPPRTQALLDAASVVGRSFTCDVLQPLVGLGAAAVVDGLRAAVDGGIVTPGEVGGRFRFAHELMRESLYADLPASHRAELHARLVGVLEERCAADRGDHLSEIAHHAVEALPIIEADRALDRLLVAAEHATATVAHEEAARLLREALRVGDLAGWDERRRAETLVRLMEVQASAGGLDEVERLHADARQVARRLGFADLLARAALARAVLPFSQLELEPGRVDMLREAVEAVPREDLTYRPMLLARLVNALAFGGEPVEHLAGEAVDAARRSGNPQAILMAAYALRWASPPSGRLAMLDKALEVAPECDDPVAVASARFGRVSELIMLGEIEEAERERERMWAEARRSRSPLGTWYAMNTDPMPELLRGEWDRALALAAEAAAYGERIENPLALVAAALTMAFVMIERDQLAEVADLVESLPDDFARLPIARAGLMWLAAMAGDVERAGSELEHLVATGFAGLPRDERRYVILAFYAQTAADLDEPTAAERVLELLTPYSGLAITSGGWAIWGTVDLYLGRLHTVLQRWLDAERCFAAAADLAVRMGSRPWEAHTRFELARMLIRRGEPTDGDRSKQLLATASSAATDLGMARLTRLIDEQRAQRPIPEPVVAPRTLRLTREGDYWTIEGATTFRLKDSKGLRHLSHLLENPETEVHVMTLADAEQGHPTAVVVTEPWPALDGDAKAAYKRRARDLQEEIDEAARFNDPERKAKAETELEFLLAELSRATGLHGRDRRTGLVEQTRVNVTKTIRSTLERIAAQDPALGTYLRASVRTGTYCAYEPSRAPKPVTVTRAAVTPAPADCQRRSP